VQEIPVWQLKIYYCSVIKAAVMFYELAGNVVWSNVTMPTPLLQLSAWPGVWGEVPAVSELL